VHELTVESEFCAAHAIVIRGVREPVHGHNWKVTVAVCGSELDADGLLFDFHEVERVLGEVLGPWRNADLNAAREFQQVNPTAECVARTIALEMQGRLRLPVGVRVSWVRVTEAPGCAAMYRVNP
jgi:6-pyruvoyltetrahydropterin/6-carboxytetrahydropterin synthase